MDTNDVVEAPVEAEPVAPLEKAPPIESRFLFVDIAAMRAKQLRRGARPRLDSDPDAPPQPPVVHKAERVAMEEVRRGLVQYSVPPLPGAPPAE